MQNEQATRNPIDDKAHRLATIGKLAAGVAHEINNPLAYVSSNLDALDRSVGDILSLLSLCERAETVLPADAPERAELAAARQRLDFDYLRADLPELVDDCREGTRLITEVVGALRDFTRQGEEPEVATDVNRLLRQALKLVWNELKKCTEVTTDLPPLPALLCRPARLNQVFVNLLVNAAQATGHQGRIRVTTRHEPDSGITVAIDDDGPGIPTEQRPRVFEAFVTSKGVEEGTGLGLAVAHDIVAHAGGTITICDSDLGGARFEVKLPVPAG